MILVMYKNEIGHKIMRFYCLKTLLEMGKKSSIGNYLTI